MHYWAGGRLMVSRAHTVLVDGALQDPTLTKQLSAFVQGFAAFAHAAKTAV